MVNIVSSLLLIPLIFGILSYIIPKLRNEFAFVGSFLSLYISGVMFLRTLKNEVIYNFGDFGSVKLLFGADVLSGALLVLSSLFTLLIIIYAFKELREYEGGGKFFIFTLFTLSLANGVLLSKNIFMFLFFWSTMLFTVYGLLIIGKKGAYLSAEKAFFLLGLSDVLLIAGMVLLVVFHGDLIQKSLISLNTTWAIVSFIFIAVGAFAKAGAYPLHTWIPKAAETSPASVMAFIPASLDKILGIYLFARAAGYIFNISSNFTVHIIFLTLGAFTVIAAVFMAMVQHEAQKLLSYHAISQVGYMILGISTGIPLGIAGGIFHMINNTLYKTSLFLSAGAASHRAKSSLLENLGGLARYMPITFTGFLIAALSISGVPPLNGFFSKWMIYQAFVELLRKNAIYVIFVISAMFGSVLTLASFMKLTHSIFLGKKSEELKNVREVPFVMWFPIIVLAFLCILLGVFGYEVPLKLILVPSIGREAVKFIGIWNPQLMLGLLCIGVGIGYLFYIYGKAYSPKYRKIFIGGEILTGNTIRYTGPHFYQPMKEMRLFSDVYRFAEEGAFDIYYYLKGIVYATGEVVKAVIHRFVEKIYEGTKEFIKLTGRLFSSVHRGRLIEYISWISIGIFFIMFVFIFGRL